MAYYYCIEDQSIYSADQIREEFDMFRSEGEYTEYTFPQYLSECMYTENGSLIPLPEYIGSLKKKLYTYELLSMVSRSPGEYAEDIEQLNSEINRLNQYK